MKNKTTSSVVSAFEKILKDIGKFKSLIYIKNNLYQKSFKDISKFNDIKISYVNLNNHLIPHTGNRLGCVDRFIQNLRLKIEKYCDEHNTNKFIDVIDDLVYNINNSYNTGINSIPNNPNVLQIEQIMTRKYIKALETEKVFNIGDHVRCILNKQLFDKGSKPRWSSLIYTIEKKQEHSYLLSNNKWYKYYHIQKVELQNNEQKDRLNQLEQIKKERTISRRLKKVGVELQNIIKNKRKRKPTDRLKF